MLEQDGKREKVGLLCIIFAVQCSVLANTFAKVLGAIPTVQLMQARFLLQWCCSVGLSLAMKRRGHEIHLTGVPGFRGLLAARAIAYTSAIASFWSALRFLEVGEATAVVYLHPIMCGIAARYFLGEKLGWPFWAQALLSFTGVGLVANPSTPGSSSAHGPVDYRGVLLALFSSCCFATGNCLVRLLPAVHPLETQVFSDSLIGLVVMPVMLLASGNASDWSTWNIDRVALLGCFVISGLGTSFLAIAGFKMAQAVKAALFMYLEVPSAFAMQVLFFGQAPTTGTVLGASCITIAALARLVYEALYAGGELPAEVLVSPMMTCVASPLLSACASPTIRADASPCALGLKAELLPPLSPLSLPDRQVSTQSWVRQVSPLGLINEDMILEA